MSFIPTRRTAVPPGRQEIFKDFKGYLQADAYSAYDGLYTSGKIVEVGCMMHARRKFYEARTSDPPRSHQALAWIGLLYDVEREAKERTRPTEYEAFVAVAARAAGGAIAADLRAVPCLAGSRAARRCCPRARSARRSSMR